MNVISWQHRSFQACEQDWGWSEECAHFQAESWQGSFTVFPAPDGLGEDFWGEAENSRGTDWPTGTPPAHTEEDSPPSSRCPASQMQLHLVSFPPGQLWNSVRSFISLLFWAKLIKTNWSLKYPPPLQRKPQDISSGYLPRKVAASRLFSSTLLFGPGSVEIPLQQVRESLASVCLAHQLGVLGTLVWKLVQSHWGESLPLATQHLPGKLLCTKLKPLAGHLDLVFQNLLEYIECTSLGSD